MLSVRLIQLAESHWRDIAELAARRLAADPRSSNYGQMKASEIHARAHEILDNLSFWLAVGDRADLHRRYVVLGQIRCSEGMPAMQVVRKLQVVKQAIREYARDYAPSPEMVDLREDDELTTVLDYFFDEAICGIVKGYELQWDFDEDLLEIESQGTIA